MITIDKVKEHIALVEEAAARAQKIPSSKAAKKETDQWMGVRDSLLQVLALLDIEMTEESFDRQHEACLKKADRYIIIKYAPEKLKAQLKFLNYILEKNNDLLCGVLSFASSPA